MTWLSGGNWESTSQLLISKGAFDSSLYFYENRRESPSDLV